MGEAGVTGHLILSRVFDSGYGANHSGNCGFARVWLAIRVGVIGEFA